MKNRRVDEIRKRIAKRKADQQRKSYWEEADAFVLPEQEFSEQIIFEEPKETTHPLFRKEVFLFKILCSACLILITAVLFKNPAPSFEEARSAIRTAMGQEFQFATVSKWYEEQFGKPLTLLPSSKTKLSEGGKNYAVPASGKVLQSFKANGQGVLVQTNINASVDAVNEGVAIFVGKKEDLGNTIIIQHADGTESWYGNLADVSVALYDYVKKKQKIGIVENSQDGKAGNFYFAFKKDEKFVDPIQVISFD
ncbi:M23 family metallopeptidase [Ectobacillus panaciterrae]|uniref:M23 family metallopeptidase n=1 Tax=Ectobacillus panaciterrae TaxID=363872 RepID=UPI0004911E7F|nr:M23 family metallopeptidase [Ectobacillus panaciterrae]